jgi:hypothetical protein
MAAAISFIAKPVNPAVLFANADGTAFKPIYTGGTLGSRIDTFFATNSDTANPATIQFAIQVAGVDYPLGECVVAPGAGTDGVTHSAAPLNSIELPGLITAEAGAIFLQTGAILRARVKTTITGANLVKLIGFGGDY